MFIRQYQPCDCREITELFYHTVHSVNARDYTERQLNVWATGEVDLENWNRTLVAVEEGRIIGFGDIDKSGYLDRLYVHKDYQGRGVASGICDVLEAAVSGKKLSVHASITARPFFEKRGYKVVKEQQVERQGVFLTNYVMER